MKLKATTVMMLCAVTIVLLFSSAMMMAVPVSGHSGVSLSGEASGVVNIDGIIDPVEWATADSEPFVISKPSHPDEHLGTLYVMNDYANLYLAVAIEDPTLNDHDMVWFIFDNNNDGYLDIMDGEDTLRMWMDLVFEDMFINTTDIGTIPVLDTTIDGSGATSSSDGTNYFELSHPIDSGDTHDFSLSWGDTVGFALCYFDDALYKGMWPFAPGQAMYWHDIVICTPDDSDGDGLTDAEEVAGWDITEYGCFGVPQTSFHVTSDPDMADEDGDGLNDYEEKEGWHVSYVLWGGHPVEYDVSSHPRSADFDDDGKSDFQERIAGTDPNKRNTDCDWAWDTHDGFEIDNGMNPLNWDTDDDGIMDGEEIDMWIDAAGYDPKQPDLVPPSVLLYAASGARSPTIPAWIDIDPGTLNLKSQGEWVAAYVELPEGYDVYDVLVETVMLDGVLPADWGEVQNDTLMVKFDRASVISYIYNVLEIEYGDVTLTVSGRLSDATVFEGSDAIRVIFAGDINGDGKVNVIDLAMIGRGYGSIAGEPSYHERVDLNSDGTIDIEDIVITAINYGATTPE